MLNSMNIHAPFLLVLFMALCTGYVFWRVLKFGAPALAPVGRILYQQFYHNRYSAHSKRGISRERARAYKMQEIRDLADDNISVPENWATEVKAQVKEATWSQITAQHDREMVAAYERTDSGQLRALPFGTSEMPAITADYPVSNVRVYWGSQDTAPDVLPNSWDAERAPYPTDPEVDPFAYDARRWAPTQVLEPVG